MARKGRNLEGLETVQRVFRTIPEESAKRITAALNKGAEEIAERARILVPEQDSRDGGDLKRSIKTEISAISSLRGGTSAAVFVFAGDRMTGSIDYAKQQEFGRAPGPDGHPGHAAQEFFWPAYYSVRKRVRSRVKREVARAARLTRKFGLG